MQQAGRAGHHSIGHSLIKVIRRARTVRARSCTACGDAVAAYLLRRVACTRLSAIVCSTHTHVTTDESTRERGRLDFKGVLDFFLQPR
jgi:hypothetical protein